RADEDAGSPEVRPRLAIKETARVERQGAGGGERRGEDRERPVVVVLEVCDGDQHGIGGEQVLEPRLVKLAGIQPQVGVVRRLPRVVGPFEYVLERLALLRLSSARRGSGP